MTDIDIAKAVAERCGWPRELVWWNRTIHITREKGCLDAFDPANELKDAFCAADAVGLFDKFRGELCKTCGEWTLHYDGGDEIVTALGTTPARAICAAILKLPRESTP